MAEYLEVDEARARSGLRLVLSAGVPGPWGEAAKAILHVKKLPYLKVRQEGGGENRALKEWTGQTSAPVAVWNDDPPRTTSREILFLAERLAPEPPLLPEDSGERVLVLGIADEIHGELGFGWCRRLMIFDAIFRQVPMEDPAVAGIVRMARKYGYDAAAAARAPARCASILRMLSERLEAQQARGRRWLVGNRLSAADLYWATFAAMVEPLPPELCPMPDMVRQAYHSTDPELRDAAGAHLLAHRDAIYRDFLELPMDF